MKSKIIIAPPTPVSVYDILHRAISDIDQAIEQTKGGRIGGTPLWSSLHAAKQQIEWAIRKLEKH